MARLSWPDLIIDDVTGAQFGEWIAAWAGVVTGRVAPAFLTRFGHWYLRRPEGHVELLDVYTGQLSRAADDYDGFIREVNEVWWQEVYLSSELVLQLHEAGKVAGPGQCYAVVPHPAPGGPNPSNGVAVDVRFVQVMDVPLWQRLCAQFLGVGPG